MRLSTRGSERSSQTGGHAPESACSILELSLQPLHAEGLVRCRVIRLHITPHSGKQKSET